MAQIKLASTVVAAAALLMAACSSSTTTATSSTTSAPAARTPAASAPASTAAAAASTASGLSGSWSGQYSGNYQGTFALRWHQSGSNLKGTIRISAPATSLIIRGTVVNGVIRFGTVGSLAITYSGSVSGNTMSGTYQVGGSNAGPWSASKVP
jgi:hypothetical protein